MPGERLGCAPNLNHFSYIQMKFMYVTRDAHVFVCNACREEGWLFLQKLQTNFSFVG